MAKESCRIVKRGQARAFFDFRQEVEAYADPAEQVRANLAAVNLIEHFVSSTLTEIP